MTQNLTTSEEIELAINSIPFVRALEPELVSVTEEQCHLQLDCTPHFHLQSGHSDLSPGLIAGIFDQLGSCTLTAAIGKPISKATLSMSLSFTKDLVTETSIDLYGEAELTTDELGSSSLTACNDNGVTIAHGIVSFMIGTYPGVSGNVAHRDHTLTHKNESLKPGKIDAGNFNDWMGVEFGNVDTRLKFDTHLMGSIEPVRAFHGGVVAAVMISEAIHKAGQLGDYYLSHFSLEYIRAAKDKELIIASKIIRQSRRTLVLQCDVFQEEGNRHVAVAICRMIDHK